MSEPVRCAIYTRKSSEEKLDQSFNSLDAQREAGEAYVKSQASEGWQVLDTRYDDGGFSGGTMERPGLQRLLADIESQQIDVVVVYKIDRLTRSLSDFSRIVEVFEKASVSFVSVTQSFNTTNSMGRLMLNVLLSFAQFEREVTGERIRDKIAASKAKGLWMGGAVPLGYDLPEPGTRKLRVNEGEAASVRSIFGRYLELGSVHALQRELEANGVKSKARITAAGKALGGGVFSRGALFHLLRNRIYLGEIVHKDAAYQGEHAAIIDGALFDNVQKRLNGNARRYRQRAMVRMVRAPLVGKLFDVSGEPMSPTFSRGKSGRSYRYYVSAPLQQGNSRPHDKGVRRVSALAIERVLVDAVARWSGQTDQPLRHIRSVRLLDGGLAIELPANFAAEALLHLTAEERVMRQDHASLVLILPLQFPLRGGRSRVTNGDRRTASPDPVLIAALRKAHRMTRHDGGFPQVENAPVSPYERSILRLAFLAPDLQRDILAGHQPAGLNLERLIKTTIPIAWSDQRGALGWANAA
jgi:DNA invertase Pin-like site-specific DNA recombinase